MFFAIVYLYWSALGLEDQEALKLDNQAQILEAAGLILYGMFYVFLIIVLLNALIAVMSEVYNAVEVSVIQFNVSLTFFECLQQFLKGEAVALQTACPNKWDHFDRSVLFCCKCVFKLVIE